VPKHSFPGDEEERRKLMLAFLRRSEPYFMFDNVSIRMESDALDAVLTTGSYSGRVLGVSKEITVPVRCSFIATSNNPDVELQLARRSVRTRMDAKREDQEFRRPEEYKHPDLKGWVVAHRADLVWSALVIVQAYLDAGRPEYQGTTLGSFEPWSRVMGGMLANVGIAGFLDDVVEVYHGSDVHSQAWRLFVGAWWDKYQGKDVTVAELYGIAITIEEFPFGRATSEQGQRQSLGHSQFTACISEG
jgi:putative DNA primase/helicase